MDITDQEAKKIKAFLCDDGNYEALKALIASLKAPHAGRCDTRPKGSFYDNAMQMFIDNGACLALNNMSQCIDGLRNIALNEMPELLDQT